MAGSYRRMFALAREARSYVPGEDAAPAWWRALGPCAKALIIGSTQGETASDGSWQPAPAGAELVTVPVWDWRPARPGGEELPFTIDIVAFHPAEPRRWWRRTGLGDALGSAGGKVIKVYETPAAWLSAARAAFARHADMVGRLAASERRAAHAAWRPGQHGICVLEPDAFAWISAFHGARHLEADHAAFAEWLEKRLKQERQRLMPRLPKVTVVA